MADPLSSRKNEKLIAARLRLRSPSGSGDPMSTQEVADAINAFLWAKHEKFKKGHADHGRLAGGHPTVVDHRFVSSYEAGRFWWPSEHYREAFRHVLRVETDSELGFRGTRSRRTTSKDEQASDGGTWSGSSGAVHRGRPNEVAGTIWPEGHPLTETMDVIRRDLLRVLSVAGAVLAMPGNNLQGGEAGRSSRTPGLTGATTDEFAALNAQLWTTFAASTVKADALPAVALQLGVLTERLARPCDPRAYRRLCGLAGDLFQLAGEIAFDADRYGEAAHCYVMAAAASKEALEYDLWACALTRHAYIEVYERRFDHAAPLLAAAANVARRGDSELSTRHWVSAVQAQTFAGLGDLDACQRALDAAERVHHLNGPVHNGGWLRFDGSRLGEERGTSYVELHRPDLAEAVLTTAAQQNLSIRRRGGVLTDLAMVGVQRRDIDQLVMYANAALDTARQSGSGVTRRKLSGLQTELGPFHRDRHVRFLSQQITRLTGGPATR